MGFLNPAHDLAPALDHRRGCGNRKIMIEIKIMSRRAEMLFGP